MSEQDKQQEPGAGAHNRILDWAEAGLWAVLLVVGTMVGLEVLRDTGPKTRPIAERGPVPTGLIEAEDLPVIAKSGNFTFWLQPSSAFPGGRWSKDGHMFAQNVKKGDWIELRLPEREPGIHQLSLFLTKSGDYGIVTASLNGTHIGTFDLWSGRGVVPTGELDVGEVELRGSDDVLRLAIDATNIRATMPFYQFGIDGIRIREPAPDAGDEDAENEASATPANGAEAGGEGSDQSPSKEQ